MSAERGKFIVFEGIDGSGKTTQINKFITHAAIDDQIDLTKIFTTQEPSAGPIGRLLREHYLNGARQVPEKIINEWLFPADRYDHILNQRDGILKTLNDGYHVICDRFYYSTLVYSTYQWVDDRTIWESKFIDSYNKHRMFFDLIVPDLIIWLDINPEQANNNIDTRNEEKSIFESTEKLMKLRKAYMYTFVELYSHNAIRIDGNQSIDDVAANIYPQITNTILRK